MPHVEPTSPHHDPGGSPPLVSVVIAAYNAADFIEATCRSVMRQTYQTLEILVVDDGSTDRTAAVVEALAVTEPRIRLNRQQNHGVAAAMRDRTS